MYTKPVPDRPGTGFGQVWVRVDPEIPTGLPMLCPIQHNASMPCPEVEEAENVGMVESEGINASDRVGEEEDDDGIDHPEVTNGDDLRKLPSASKTSTAPKKKPNKAKGYFDPLRAK